MHALATFGPGEFSLFPKPGIRKIAFEEDPPQFSIAHLLVHGWTVHRETQDCTDPPTGDFAEWGRSLNNFGREEREQLPQNPDTSTVHTQWRDQLYYMWNHVFFDVGNFMANVYATATFKPPNTDVFAIEFPGNGEKAPVEKVWESETLIAAAYLAPGVSVRLETITPGREGQEPFHASDLDHKSRYNVWYVRKDTKVQFHVHRDDLEGERGHGPEDGPGLAAVVVFGNMLGEPRPPSVESESDEDEIEDKDNE